MAKKAELLEEAKKLGLDVNESNTIAEIEAAIAEAPQKEATETEETSEEKAARTTKAGKHSAKAQREAEEAEAKEARKTSGDTSAQDGEGVTVKKGPKPITRPKIERRGKKYQAVAKAVEKDRVYSLDEAIELATKTATTKFDSSVELHVNLGVDPRQADQNIRATVSLPHGTGKKIRVAVFAPSEQLAAAKKAGADIAGEDELLAQLDKEQLNFDVLIATPQMMPKLGKYARLLGPRGLMPNPKSGTVAVDVAKAVTDAKAGKVEYRVDKQAVVHLAFGKVSFGKDKLQENAKAFFASLQSVKPTTLKGGYIKAISIATTMGPGVKVDSNSL
ncbi:MAG TPA: 50S ribosomal protein L1 [Verrucomicrobiae bacterium]|nr:50S ribosomal protein L1 [Verrucomicrobiae bacterium]